jgi:hypothetical protein
LPQILTIPELKGKDKHISQTSVIIYNGPVTRSITGKLPPLSIKLNIIDIDDLFKQTTLKNTYALSRLPKISYRQTLH